MMTTEHAYSPEEIMAFLDGELPAAAGPAIEEHLATCANCRRLADDLRNLSEQLRTWQPVPASIEMPASSMSTHTLRRGFSWNWRWLTLPSAVLGVLLVFLVAGHRSETRQTHMFMKPEGVSSLQPAGTSFPAPPPPPPPVASALHRHGYADARSSVAVDKAELAKVPPGAPMIARQASVSVIVPQIATARTKIESVLRQNGGYIAELNQSMDEDAGRSLRMSLNVPESRLTEFLNQLRTLGQVTHEEQRGEEVSEQHRDLEVRLQNARETETRMRSILAERTGKLSDVLEVEQELARVREEIESLESDSRNLDHRISYSTVELVLTEQQKPVPHRSSWNQGWHNLRENVIGLLSAAEEFGPVLLFWGALLGIPAWLGWRRYRSLRDRS